MGIVYGTRGATLESKYVAAFRHVHPRFMNILDFGKAPPLDLFPFLVWVPEYFAEWKRTVKEIRTLHGDLYQGLYAIVENRLASGRGNGCFIEEMILKAGPIDTEARNQLL